MPANQEIVEYIYQSAVRRGIDPNVALKVARAEALNVFDPTKPDMGGDEGSSFGPYQFHYAGMSKSMPNAGLGDEFTARTGLDARDPSTWRQQVDFALDWASRKGWGDWMGAAAAGVGDMEGISSGAGGGGGMVATNRVGGGSAPDFSSVANASNPGGFIDLGGDPHQALADAIAMREALDSQDQPRSLLADTLSSSVTGAQSSDGGGITPTAADQNQGQPIGDFGISRAPAVETPDTGAAPMDVGSGLADLFQVKDIGKPNEIDPYTGQVKPFRRRVSG